MYVPCLFTVYYPHQLTYGVQNIVYIYIYIYTGCNRRNGPDFGRVFLMLNYTKNPKTPISKVQWLRRYRPEKCVDFFGVCVLYSICDVILGVAEGWAPSTTIAFPRFR